MWNSSPITEWNDTVTIFWTFSGGDTYLWGEASLGTWILMLLGLIWTFYIFIRFVTLESGKLNEQAERLRASGALDRPPDTPTTSAS